MHQELDQVRMMADAGMIFQAWQVLDLLGEIDRLTGEVARLSEELEELVMVSTDVSVERDRFKSLSEDFEGRVRLVVRERDRAMSQLAQIRDVAR
jgi:hypothetical protein